MNVHSVSHNLLVSDEFMLTVLKVPLPLHHFRDSQELPIMQHTTTSTLHPNLYQQAAIMPGLHQVSIKYLYLLPLKSCLTTWEAYLMVLILYL
jgi:hypothetical protein